LLAAICAALVAIAAGPASADQLRGVALHPMDQDRGAAVILNEFGMLHHAGATSIRFDVYWSAVETEPGRYDDPTVRWIDWVMAEARARGLKVILDVWSTPCWDSSAPPSVDPKGCRPGWWHYPVGDYPPTNAEDYARFAAFAAERWGSDLAALELWNEPNGGQSFRSSRPAADYAALVKAAYPAVKAVAPGLPVIMSLGGTDTRFLDELYFFGVQGYYDGVAVHPYNQPTFAGLTAFRSDQLAHGDADPLWVTEVGWSSATSTERGQARDVASALRQLAALPYVAAVEIYDMRDDPRDPGDPGSRFGLLYADMIPKPAWAAFASTLAALDAPQPQDRGLLATAPPAPRP
jgi:arabinogalactan endo-1,4-beta-galactosidase